MSGHTVHLKKRIMLTLIPQHRHSERKYSLYKQYKNTTATQFLFKFIVLFRLFELSWIFGQVHVYNHLHRLGIYVLLKFHRESMQ